MEPIVVKEENEAEVVLKSAKEIIDNFSVLTINDLYELCGIDPRYEDAQFGWKDLSGFEIKKIGDGWSLNFPEPERLVDEEVYLIQYTFNQPGAYRTALNFEKRCHGRTEAQKFVDDRKNLSEFTNIKVWRLVSSEFIK